MDRDKRRMWTTVKVCGVVLVTAIAVSIAVPTAVGAAGQLVTLVDSDGPSEAQVDAGKLRIGDGVGSPNTLTVDGLVVARPQFTSEYRRYYVPVAGNGICTRLAAAPTGKAVVLQSLGFGVYHSPSPSSQEYFTIFATPDCTGAVVTYVTPPGLGLIDVPIEPGLISKTGFSVKTTGASAADVHGVGYLIGSAHAPAAASEPDSSGSHERPMP